MGLIKRLGIAVVAVSAIALLLVGMPNADATDAGLPHYPDLQSTIPMEFGIAHPTATTREFRYTHIISNLGDGPLEIMPTYDPTTDTAVGTQRVYTHNASGQRSIALQIPIVGKFIYHAPHGHYHFPLAEFGLYSVAADGTRGVPVSLSPKVGFCIANSLVVQSNLPHDGWAPYDTPNCSDPRSVLGITVGWGDLYDFRDDGQAIDATNVPDGTYWFHSVADPWNYLAEKDETNNVTDVKVRILGDTVTPLEVTHPGAAPPPITMTAPTDGSTVSGTVGLAATADPTTTAGVQFIVDGSPVGAPDTTAPYEASWDSTTAVNGSHVLAAQLTSVSGVGSTSPTVTVNVANSPPAGAFTIDANVAVDGRGTVTTPAFSCLIPGETLLALVSSDGPAGVAQTTTVSGGGLAWSLVQRTNGQPGTTEIWKATSDTPRTNIQITSTQSSPNYNQALNVVSVTSALGVGAKAGSSALTGAAGVTLTTTAAGSMVFGVGNDWDHAVARTLRPGQESLHQWVEQVIGDTFWSQRVPSVASPGPVTIGTTAPTNDRWNFAAVELVPVPGSPPPPSALTISDVLVSNRTATGARVTWTTNLASDSRVDYGLTTAYGSVVGPVGPVSTSHSIDLTALTPATTYHYALRSVAADGTVGTAGDFIFTTASVSTITCTITSPTDGAVVNQGNVDVAASASSTASVSGVQFRRNGANLGAEDIQLPYALVWDASGATPGSSHTFDAIVRDPTGNTLVCPPVTITIAQQATTTTVAPTTTTTMAPTTTTTMAPTTTTTAAPASALIAAYNFNENGGTGLTDRTGLGHTGTIAGGTWTAAGRYGGALTFNGTSTMVTVNDAADLRLTTGMTIEAWVRPTSTLNASWRTVVMKERTNGLSYALYGNGNDRRVNGYVNSGGADDRASSTSQLAVNTWTHIATTYDGANIRVYVNGVLQGTRAHTGAMVTSTGALRIGANTVWGERFAGQIDDVRIYNVARTAAQITTDLNTAVA